MMRFQINSNDTNAIGQLSLVPIRPRLEHIREFIA